MVLAYNICEIDLNSAHVELRIRVCDVTPLEVPIDEPEKHLVGVVEVGWEF